MTSVVPGATSNRKWWTLLAVSLGTFMLLLDVTIVNVALDSIESDLGSSFADLQWVVDAYALGLAALLLTFGSLSDIFGRRKIFAAGLIVFTMSSLACALSHEPLVLNISRAVQGIGAAGMFATALALLGQEFSGKERGTAFGVWGAVTGGAVAIGPLVGGALTDTFGWESIFLVNIPIGLLTLVVTLTRVPAHAIEQRKVRVDLAGLLTFSFGLFLLIFGLVRGNLDGWSSPLILFCLIGSAVLLASFIVIELKTKSPMLDLSLFRVPTFVGASVAALALSGSIFALFLYITLYFQNVLGYGPLETGVRFLPNTILSFVIAALAGKASASLPVKGLIGVGLGCIGVGLILMSVMVSDTSGYTAILPGLVLTGFGVGLMNPPLASTAIGVVRQERSGMAGGINGTFRQVGIATGIAGLGAIFQHRVDSGVRDALGSALEPDDVDRVASAVSNGNADSVLSEFSVALQERVGTALASGYVSGLDAIFVVGGAIALVGSVVVFFTVRKQDFQSGGHAA